jgi:V8-like Glu-specific endopeptidase
MRKLLVILLFFLSSATSQAQDIVGFSRDDFGKITLSNKQSAGQNLDEELEVSIENYNNESVSNYGADSLFARLGRPVGRLDVLTDRGIFPCTAFLVSEKYLVTNYHCVPGIIENPRIGASRIEAIQFVLGYIQNGVEDSVRKYTVGLFPAETDKDLDYSVIEVFGNPAKDFGAVRLAAISPLANHPFWIIGHPLGEAQRISREKCKSGSPAISGHRLRHTCDTLPGNSGSPVFDPGSQSVIALHHAGSKLDSINFAIPLSEIVKQSEILRALAKRSDENEPRSNASVGSHAYDGAWVVKITKIAASCQGRAGQFPVSINKSQVSGTREITGTVDQQGNLEFTRRSVLTPENTLRFIANLSNRSATGTMAVIGRSCYGEIVVDRLDQEAGPSTLAETNRNQEQPFVDVQKGSAFDGLWNVTFISHSNCRRGKNGDVFPITIRNSLISGRRVKFGKVREDGQGSFTRRNSTNKTDLKFYIDLSGDSGSGKMSVKGDACTAVVSLARKAA